ncbi:hypothetical protein Taro_047920 [Colocasia esculenta]|uniref:Pentatricopeptide repeat-containing protein n=1 Tax=Colocasia esculenta TaxID=4460 RepID=A0A843WWQ8_COLES|nr:hypothetical protein [Colocasia esculenta]
MRPFHLGFFFPGGRPSHHPPLATPRRELPLPLFLPSVRRNASARNDIARLNALLASRVRGGDSEGALLLFLRMHRDGGPLDGYSFTPALSACAALPLSDGLLAGRLLHALGVKNGSLSGHITCTALLDMYAKCCDEGSTGDAVRVFDEMKSNPSRDAVAWNALLSCYVRHGRAAEAISVFRAMTMDEGCEATGFTLATVLKACGSLKAHRLGEQVHASLVVVGARDSIVLGTALVDFYSDCGLIVRAMQVFDRLGCRKDAAAYSALIHGCVQNRRYGEAFAMLRKLAAANATVLTTALTACSESWSLQYGKQIHSSAVRRGFTFDTLLCNALLDMYAKCGSIDYARSVFDLMNERNVVSWTSIIHAYGSHGRGAEAVRLLGVMEEAESGRVSPNAATFLSVLSACGHAGLVEEGRACFVSMRERHGVKPGAEHYTCLIDLLGRAGRIEEAWDLFTGVSGNWVGGGEASAATCAGVCVAMLNACGACMDVERGETVAARLLDLEPESAGVYVLVSNFYAAVGMWEKVEELRRVMKEKGMSKEVGSSWA